MVLNMHNLLFCVIILVTLTVVHLFQNTVSTVRLSLFFLLAIAVFSSGQVANAQYVPATNQAFQLGAVYNPAFSGVDRFGDLRLGYRKQWAGFANAPQFLNLSYNFRLKQPTDLTYHGVRTGLGRQIPVPAKKLLIMGAGVHAFNEKIGPIDRVGGGFTYSLNFVFSKHIRLATGIGTFIENIKVNQNDLYWGENVDELDPVYKSMANGDPRSTQFSTRLGVLLYGKTFYVGAAYLPLMLTDLTNNDVIIADEYYKASVQAGVSFAIGPESVLRPSIAGLLLEEGTLVLDYNLKFYLKGKTWIGATYRSIKSGVVGLGLNVSSALAFSYSYEFATGDFSGFAGASQDIMLTLRVNNVKKEKPLLW